MTSHWCRWSRCVGIALAWAAVILPAVAGAETRTTTGALADGTAYRVDVPDPWNGILLVGLDYAAGGGGAGSALSQALLARGYAMGGTTRLVTGWAIDRSIANQVATVDIAIRLYGRPTRTIVLGSSLGAHTGAATIQAHADRFDGAVLMCGGLAGTVALWNSKLDGVFAARTLLAPSDPTLPVIGIPGNFAMTARPAWLKMLAAAQESPAGRARIALAAVLAQLPTWSDPRKAQPGVSDIDGQQRGLYDSLAGGPLPMIGQAMSSRNEIERRSGGNISSNVGIDYRRQLARAGGRELVIELYRKAGLDLDADLDALEKAPRIAADAKALAWTTPGVWDGKLAVPVLTVNGIGDNISPVSGQSAYEAVVRAAGRSEMLRQVYTNSAGHCGFSAAEGVAAVEALVARLNTGRWGDTTAEAMKAKAESLELGAARFVPFTPPAFVR